MRLHFITWIEGISVFIGLMLLGIIGTMITPKGVPSRPLSVFPPSSPSEIIDDARSGYQVDACVRDISPSTVLSDSLSGAPELIVLEGASVMECFPDLAEFAAQMREENARGQSEVRPVEGRAFGSDVRTSVRVLPPAPTSTSENSTAVTTTTTETTIPIGVGTTSPSSADIPVATPISTLTGESGGYSSGGGAIAPTEIPSVDVFEMCMTEVFGQVVPENPSPESIRAFEECLVR